MPTIAKANGRACAEAGCHNRVKSRKMYCVRCARAHNLDRKRRWCWSCKKFKPVTEMRKGNPTCLECPKWGPLE